MTDRVLTQMISSYMKTDQPQYVFGWQGGEPALMGIGFYRRVTDLEQKYGRSGSSVGNGLQTNGTLINDEFAAHLSKYNFLVGVSLDGPREVHDRHRTAASGRGSHADTLRGIDCLKRNRVEFNSLTLVTSANAGKAKEVYRYLCGLGIYFHQYIPCVEFDAKNELMPFAITGGQWGDFLCELFDEWVKSDTRRVSVRLFDSILSLMVDGTCTICHMEENCCQYFVVEYNGDVYPCDFFVEENKKLGNLMENSWEELRESSKYFDFGRQKSAWDDRCGLCAYLRYCAGDCLKYRLFEDNNPRKLSWLCEGWKQFYGHSLGGFEKLAEAVRKQREGTSPSPTRAISGRV